jgi:hypothetical protein
MMYMNTRKPSMIKYDVVPGFKGNITGGQNDMIRRATSMYPKPPPRKWNIDECIEKIKWDANSKSKITTLYLPHGELYNPMIHKAQPRYVTYEDLYPVEPKRGKVSIWKRIIRWIRRSDQ